jgi:hypothetical protein
MSSPEHWAPLQGAKSLFIKWTINDDESVTATKSRSKLPSKDAKRLKYKDWLMKIEPYIQRRREKTFPDSQRSRNRESKHFRRLDYLGKEQHKS